MPFTIDEIKSAIDILFTSSHQCDEAFAKHPFLDELNRAIIYVNSGGIIDYEYFNRVLIASNLGPVDPSIFERYFPLGINSSEKLREGTLKFVKDALLHFGSFHQAFLRIKADASLLPAVENKFGREGRAPFELSNPLKVEELAYLGYVSGEVPNRMASAHKVILKVLALINDKQVTPEIISDAARRAGVDIEKNLNELNTGLHARGKKQVTIDDFISSHKDIEQEIKLFIDEVKRYRLAGIKNQEQYINSAAEMDVYVATSMRDDRDYREMHAFIRDVFGQRDIARLNLRYFDPTQAYCPNKYDKGLVECLMIRCAKVTIYCAQLQDTMGKDSELAITLGLGKPVIVYVPRGETPSDQQAYAKRARTFAEVHPLSLQVDQLTGNSNGIIVVRDAQECANVLYALATKQLKVQAERKIETDPLSGESSTCWVLREEITPQRSVIRVATGWKHLRTAFWSAFRPDLNIH